MRIFRVGCKWRSASDESVLCHCNKQFLIICDTKGIPFMGNNPHDVYKLKRPAMELKFIVSLLTRVNLCSRYFKVTACILKQINRILKK